MSIVPARVVSYDKESGELVLHNYMDFDDLNDYVNISYELTQDGLVIGKGKLSEVSVAPHSEEEDKSESQCSRKRKMLFKTYLPSEKRNATVRGRPHSGFDEIEVSQKDAKCQLAEKWMEKTATNSELQVNENDTQIHIKGCEFSYTIDRRTALFTEMKFAGRNI